MGLNVNTEVLGRAKAETDAASAADLSTATGSPATYTIGGSEHVTIYISGTAADSIAVELSPDSGTSWYTPDESPVAIGSDGTLVVDITYAATDVRLTNETGGDATTVQVVEVA